MALNFSQINQNPTTHAAAVWSLIQSLEASGWDMPEAGDGLSAYGVSAVTGAGTGAGGLNNPSAWVQMRQPIIASNPRRSFIFQRDSSGGSDGSNWLVMYTTSSTQTVVGTSTTIPTFSDGVQANLGDFGGGGNPSAQNLFPKNGAGTYYFHAVSDVDRWYMVGTAIGTGAVVTAAYLDPLLSGTFSTDDSDPVVMYFAGPNTSTILTIFYQFMHIADMSGQPLTIGSLFDFTNGPRGWFRSTLAGAHFTGIPSCALIHSFFSNYNPTEMLGLVELQGNTYGKNTPPILTNGTLAPVGLVNLDTLILGFNGGSASVVFDGTETTNAAVVDKINGVLGSNGFAVVNTAGYIVITGSSSGPGVSIKVSGTAFAKVGFSSSSTAFGSTLNTSDALIKQFSDSLNRYYASSVGDASYALAEVDLGKLVSVTVRGIFNSMIAPIYGGTDPHNGKDRPQPMVYGRSMNTGYGGIKGWSQLANWSTRPHNNGDLITITISSDVRVVYGHTVLPWKPDGTVPLV